MKTELLSFNIAGVSFRPQDDIDALSTTGEKIRLVFDPTNPYDANAIRVECEFILEKGDDGTPLKAEWRHIGFVPKKNYAAVHLFRKAKIPLLYTLFVNHDAAPQDKCLVRVYFDGDEAAEIINA